MLGKDWQDRIYSVLVEWPDNEMRAQDIHSYLLERDGVAPKHVRAVSEVLSLLWRRGLLVSHGAPRTGVWYAVARTGAR